MISQTVSINYTLPANVNVGMSTLKVQFNWSDFKFTFYKLLVRVLQAQLKTTKYLNDT